jgi:hypothetical protein
MFKKSYWIVMLFFAFQLINTHSYSQETKGAVGVRFGYGMGLTGTYFFDKNAGHALEILLRYGYQGLVNSRPGANIQVLYEKHWFFGRHENWSAYVGAGPTLGFGKKKSLIETVYAAFGVSPIGGIDFTTQNLIVPIVLALDYKPTLFGNFPLNAKYKGTKPEFEFTYIEVAFSVRVGIGGKNKRRR